jgi:hypothetical protein
MDPIHPIVPTPPTTPPVTPAPLVGRIDRDQPRGQGGADERRRRRDPRQPGPHDAPAGEGATELADDGDHGLHINVTA